ncbi:hypothetical protein [Allokutzneria sp. NRRL B-24872]|uniref:hypothetical protein n=1 Tax=Allokutzneria sp. NRRL B-24872 TaxID=1137961 RepID=UPI001FEF8B77|nr:hypothetical protein [Allokutzneria sp. NRRL B-24872]
MVPPRARPGDRRQVRIVATEAGRALVPEIERVWAELAEDALRPELEPELRAASC